MDRNQEICDDNGNQTSHYALQIALQTMKERCIQLQSRLTNLEEEKLKLAIEKTKSENNKNVNIEDVDLNKLKEENEMLIQQKDQLTHHIHMVASENKQLWNKLSILTEENCQENLNKILNYIPEQSLNLMKGHSERSTEVSRSTLDPHKNDVKDVTSSMKDFEFNLSMNQIEADSNNFEMSELVEQLNHTKTQMKSILNNCKKQQDGIRNIIQCLVNTKKEKENNPIPCSNCDTKRRHIRDKTYKVNKSTMQDIDIIDNNSNNTHLDPDQSICPMCRCIVQDELLDHVFTHFEESDEPCTLLSDSPMYHF